MCTTAPSFHSFSQPPIHALPQPPLQVPCQPHIPNHTHAFSKRCHTCILVHQLQQRAQQPCIQLLQAQLAGHRRPVVTPEAGFKGRQGCLGVRLARSTAGAAQQVVCPGARRIGAAVAMVAAALSMRERPACFSLPVNILLPSPGARCLLLGTPTRRAGVQSRLQYLAQHPAHQQYLVYKPSCLQGLPQAPQVEGTHLRLVPAWAGGRHGASRRA